MSAYERKLSEFSEGREFVRLTRPLRDRADASCDACGSTEPRTLYALKEEGTERFYFVGHHCLGELVRRGAVRRDEASVFSFQSTCPRLGVLWWRDPRFRP